MNNGTQGGNMQKEILQIRTASTVERNRPKAIRIAASANPRPPARGPWR